MCPFEAEGVQDPTIVYCDDADLGYAFVVESFGKFNNDSFIKGTIAATEALGVARFGKNVFMADGGRVTADRIKIGPASSLFEVYGNTVVTASDAIVRAGPPLSPIPSLPAMNQSCAELADLEGKSCSGEDVTVPAGTTRTNLAPGVYGRLFIQEGAILRLLDLGSYSFCSIRMDRYSSLRPAQQVTINVVPVPGTVSLGAGAIMTTDSNLPFVLNVGGPLLRISQGAYVNASVRVPYGKIKIQRSGHIDGCACAATIKTDKNITLTCDDGTVP